MARQYAGGQARNDVLKGMAEAIWGHVVRKDRAPKMSPPPEVAERCALDLESAYREVTGLRIDNMSSHPDVGEGVRLAEGALSRGTLAGGKKVFLSVSFESDDDGSSWLAWSITRCIEDGGEGQVARSNPTRARLNPSTNPLEPLRFAVVAEDGRVMGHVESTTAWDAWRDAKRDFGQDVIVFVETAGRPTSVGDIHWSAKRNPCGVHLATGNPPADLVYFTIGTLRKGDRKDMAEGLAGSLGRAFWNEQRALDHFKREDGPLLRARIPQRFIDKRFVARGGPAIISIPSDEPIRHIEERIAGGRWQPIK